MRTNILTTYYYYTRVQMATRWRRKQFYYEIYRI